MEIWELPQESICKHSSTFVSSHSTSFYLRAATRWSVCNCSTHTKKTRPIKHQLCTKAKREQTWVLTRIFLPNRNEGKAQLNYPVEILLPRYVFFIILNMFPSILNLLRFLSKNGYLNMEIFFMYWNVYFFFLYSINVATKSIWFLNGKLNLYCWDKSNLALIFQFINLLYFKMLLDPSTHLLRYSNSEYLFDIFHRIAFSDVIPYHVI